MPNMRGHYKGAVKKKETVCITGRDRALRAQTDRHIYIYMSLYLLQRVCGRFFFDAMQRGISRL